MSTVAQDQPKPRSEGKLGDPTKEQIDSAAGSVKSRWLSLGAETRKTAIYASAAVACLIVTAVIEFASRPADIAEYGKVGQEFFADFTDPTLASALSVSAIDADQVEAKEFSVERIENGQWVIPSHHNYPADAADQLARTASSVIGIKRGAMVTRWEADHARYGVVNPKVDTLGVDQVKGVGKRLTLRGEDDAVLADYIIGKQVEGESDQYYVRHPDEDEVYVATLNIDLSTKFTDWIETDLLDINSSDVVNVALNDYQFDELKGTVTQRDVTTLHRKSASEDWQMDGLDETTQEVSKDAIRDTVNAIANLEIAGVRPKQKGLTPDLRLDRSALGSQRDVERLQSDLLARGFLLQPAESGDSENLKLISREGELTTATNDGLVYNMYFGRVFTGSQEELEIGLNSDAERAPDDETESDSDSQSSKAGKDQNGDASASSNEATDDEASTENEKKNSEKPGRYVFVTVDFDKQFLGDQPSKPTEPEMPAELKDAHVNSDESSPTESEASVGEASTAEESSSDESESDDRADESEQEQEKETEEDRHEKLRAEYKAKQEDYEADLKKWESFQQQIKEGREKAEDLNRRFAQWYYVIPGKDYDKLALTRSDLVKEKAKDDDEKNENDVDTKSSAATTNQEAADKFLEENKSKDGVNTTDSGLQYEVIAEGQGDSPTSDSKVKVKYKGTLIDGTLFDESGDKAVEFGVSQVIKGWTEALQLMKAGAKWKLYIPPDLAYGERGSGDKIGPNSALIFEVELVSFE